MEVLSNLVWVIVALCLCGGWFAQRRARRGALLGSGIGAQLIALAVLSVILLPVISVSDDLQASHNPAEVERTSVRNDQHLLLPEAPPVAPAALAFVVTCLLLGSPRFLAFLRPTDALRPEQAGHARSLACRAPPAV